MKYIFYVQWAHSLRLIEGFCTACQLRLVDLNPRPFALKATALTSMSQRPHTKIYACRKENRKVKSTTACAPENKKTPKSHSLTSTGTLANPKFVKLHYQSSYAIINIIIILKRHNHAWNIYNLLKSLSQAQGSFCQKLPCACDSDLRR